MPSSENRGKINANYRRNINNYTIDSSVVSNGTHGHHTYPEKIKTAHPPSPSLQMHINAHPMFRAAQSCEGAPPAYNTSGSLSRNQQARPQEPVEHDEANYSSATTATPSPRPARRQPHFHQQEPRPLSDHIYSSIDSDYSTLERGGSGRRPNGEIRGPPWRPGHAVVNSNGVQAYLV